MFALPKMPIEKKFYSESQSRFIITIAPEDKEKFETEMKDFVYSLIGKVSDKEFIVADKDEIVFKTNMREMENVYRERFASW